MEREEFEQVVEGAYEHLPEQFRKAIDNVGIVVEDYPDEAVVRQMRLKSKRHLLGLYQGVPLPARGTWYGMTPVTPDRISLYQKNIEAASRTERQLQDNIRDVLIHEIGHYFGMSEDEIREAGY